MTKYVRLLRNGLLLGVMALGLATCTSVSTSQQMDSTLNLGGVLVQTPAEQPGATFGSGLNELFSSTSTVEDRAERTTAVMTNVKDPLTTQAVQQAQMFHMCDH